MVSKQLRHKISLQKSDSITKAFLQRLPFFTAMHDLHKFTLTFYRWHYFVECKIVIMLLVLCIGHWNRTGPLVCSILFLVGAHLRWYFWLKICAVLSLVTNRIVEVPKRCATRFRGWRRNSWSGNLSQKCKLISLLESNVLICVAVINRGQSCSLWKVGWRKSLLSTTKKMRDVVCCFILTNGALRSFTIFSF